jgi:hypothetical protein
MHPTFMPWVDLLPEVGDPIRKDRDHLAATLADAELLEKRAAALRETVHAGRAALLARVMRQWMLHDIVQAATAAADHDRPFPPGIVKDDELREALRALDGAASPLDILRAFTVGRVIRQHNLFSTATAAERDATLHRVMDWWNYGAVPLLARLDG